MVSQNTARLDCFNRLFRHRSKKTPKLRDTDLCEGNPPMTGGSLHKGPVTRKMFAFDDVIMIGMLSYPQFHYMYSHYISFYGWIGDKIWKRSNSLQWRRNGRHGVSNHQLLDGLFNHLFVLTSKKTSRFALPALCEGIDRWPVDSPHQGPVARKAFPWTSYQIRKIAGCACARNAGNVFSATYFKGNS